MRDIFVVTRTKREFDFFLSYAYNVPQWNFEATHGMIHFVADAEELKTQPCRVVLYGQYFRRRDWPKIETAIKMNMHRPLLVR